MNIRKRTIAVLVAVVALLCLFTISAFAAKEKTSGDYTYIVQSDNTVKITAYNGNAKDVVVPSVIEKKPVTAIGRYAFYVKTEVESITIPGSVETFEADAIYFCEKLETVTVKEGKLKSIPGTGILNCSSLKTLNLPSNVQSIGVLMGSESLKNINIASKNAFLKSVDGVVYSADGKTLIKYPQGKKAERFEVPAAVTTIKDAAFYEVKGIGKIYIPLTVETIGEMAFAYNNAVIEYAGKTVPEKFKPAFAGHTVYTNVVSLGAASKLTATSTKTTVTLKWKKVTGADGYKVEKYNSSKKKYETVKTVKDTTVKISSLKSGTTYKFRVRAYKKDSDTIYGEYSSVKQITTKLSAPSKVTSKGGTTSVKITWSKSNGADGYRLYYKSGDKWKVLVKSVKGTTYTLKDLKKATKRIYAVRAYKKTSDGTMWSDYKEFSAATKPGKAAITVKSSSAGQAALSWKKASGANTYRVYYKADNGEYKLYKTCSKPTKLTIKKLKKGKNYTFKVQAGIKVTGGTVWGSAVTKSVKIKK